jgi:hypothetical protein
VITRLVLYIQPTYVVRQDVYRNAPWDTVLEAFDEVMASAYSVSLIGDFGSPVIRELWQKTRVESVGEAHDQPEPVPESLHGGTWYDDAEEPPGHSLNVRGGVRGHGQSGCRTSAWMLRRQPAGMSCRPSTSSTGGTPSTRSGHCRCSLACFPLFWWDHLSTLLGTGLRFGKLAGLRRRRVHLGRALPVLEVGPTRYEAGRFGSGFKPRPKSDAGIRQVPLAPLVVEAIRRQLPR